MNRLRTELERMAGEFTRAVLSALASAPMEELLEQTRPARSSPRTPVVSKAVPNEASGNDGQARRARVGAVMLTGPLTRTRAPRRELQRQKDAVLSAAKVLQPAFRKADVTKKTGLTGNLSRALSELVVEGKLVRKGDRNLARYWAK